MRTMKKIVRLLAVTLMVLGVSGVTPSWAVATYSLHATSTVSNLGDFTIVYADNNSDGKLSYYGDINSFSGVTLSSNMDYTDSCAPCTFNKVWNVPTYGDFLNGGHYITSPGYPIQTWSFAVLGDWRGGDITPDHWTYTQSPVPLPPSALLLVSGLIPLAWARRKKRLGQ